MAKDFRPDPIYIRRIQTSLPTATGIGHQSWDGIHIEETRVVRIKAYEEARIENPREEINLMELHDCFSISELITYESLQISPIGKAEIDIEDGF